MENNAKKINISFIMPAYNCADTIEESVYSIINGNLEDGDEIVITDDCSSDNTPAIIKKLADKYSFIKATRHPENRGGGAARNTAVKNSTHDLIFCLDSDNLLVSHSVCKLKTMLLQKQIDAVAFQAMHFFTKTPVMPVQSWKFIDKVTLKDALSGHINPASSGNYLFTKKSWEKSGGYPEKCGALDTWGFGIRQLATGTDIYTLPQSYYNHRFGIESYWIRYNKADKARHDALAILEPFYNLIDPESLNYIKNSPAWFFELNDKPVKLSNNPVGRNGVQSIFFAEKVKRWVKKYLKIIFYKLTFKKSAAANNLATKK